MTDPTTDATADDAAVRVLVVSADEAAAGFFAALLRREGFETAVVAAERAAAETLAADPPYALVLVDADPEPVRSIRSLADPDRARVPIAVLGPPDGPDGAQAAADTAGADVWIARPVDDSDLVAAVRHAAG